MSNRRMKDGRYGKQYSNILTKEFLIEEYSKQGRTPYQIANDVGCSPKVVYNYIDYHNIPRIDFNKRKTIQVNNSYGLLTVTSYSHRLKNGTKVWNCLCECGESVQVPTHRLKNGRTKSCGCYRKRKRNHKWKGYCDISGTFVGAIKYRAGKRGLEYDLTPKFLWDLLQEQKYKCAISGLSISIDNNASIDRIDSSKGYTKDNVWWVDSKINFMKSNLSLAELISLCNSVASNQGE